jgi:hypothetical protein
MEMAATKMAVAIAYMIPRATRFCMSQRSSAEETFLATHLGGVAIPPAIPLRDPLETLID